MNNLWSPHPPSSYTVTINGQPSGLGAREEFVDRPGLWNMFWLHSTKVDSMLDWAYRPEDAPMHTLALDKCLLSAGFYCDGVNFETLCEVLTADQLITLVAEKNYHPPIRKFWDEIPSGWQLFVTDRLKSFKSLAKTKGLLIQGNFSLHKNN